jgi:hypothetical protein
LTIGIRRVAGGTLEAHAWVHRGGRVLVGGPLSSGYAPLVTWSESAA